MKLLLLFFIFLTGLVAKPTKSNFKNLAVESYTETGHAQFKKLVVDDTKHNDKILVDINPTLIESELKHLSRKFFGTKEKLFNKYIKATYESDTIFSRSNKTGEAYVFTYNLETVHYKDVSVAITGSISIKDVFKGKTNDLTTSGSFSIEHESDEYTKTTETNKMNVVVYPGKKLTLKIVGKARVTNGVAKKYFLGICVKKGSFEVVDITTAVYELVEEDA